ncbi:hypothetical protein [Salmonella phage JNwz02]|uniref:Uncharacterized protein n=1 Tax=Salmonella phage JNwz02 TaxID=2861003 RepID=A0AC61N8H5_9CAUD|nr:hypothetical protein [Salmonella phage JNwz02]
MVRLTIAMILSLAYTLNNWRKQMANPEITAQRFMLKGIIAEAGMTEEVADFQKQFLNILTQAKELGEKEHGAAIMAITLVGLDLAEESGV